MSLKNIRLNTSLVIFQFYFPPRNTLSILLPTDVLIVTDTVIGINGRLRLVFYFDFRHVRLRVSSSEAKSDSVVHALVFHSVHVNLDNVNFT